MTDILEEERERFFREKYQRRLNREASRSAKMQSTLAQLSLESQYFITPDNLERHIERELNPARVLIHHSMFGADKYGVNDEVALHAMRVHQQQNLLRMDEEKHVEKQGNRKQLFRIGLVDEEVKAANALNEEFGTSAHPIPSSFSTVNSFLFENKFIRDILYPYANVLRDDVMARKKLFEAESELHDNEEDFDEAELTTIDLNDPEDMEMLRELAQEEMIDIEELIQDVQEMQEDEQSRQASQSQGKKGKKGGASSQAGGAFASAGVSTSSHAATSGEEAQRLAVDLKKHQELERIRKSPHVRIDAEYVDNVIKSTTAPKEGKRAGFYDSWLESYPTLGRVSPEILTLNKQHEGLHIIRMRDHRQEILTQIQQYYQLKHNNQYNLKHNHTIN